MSKPSTSSPPKIEDVAMHNAESVVHTFALLKKAIDDPESVSAVFIRACKSQGQLASLELPEFGIYAMSLNTMKAHADNNGKILWQQLDAYRKAALKKHQQHAKTRINSSRGSKAYFEGRLSVVEKDLQCKINEIIQFVDRYDDLLTLSRDHARLSSTFEAKLKRHLDRYNYMDKCSGRSRLRIIDGGKND